MNHKRKVHFVVRYVTSKFEVKVGIKSGVEQRKAFFGGTPQI